MDLLYMLSLISIILRLIAIYEEWCLKRDRRRYREALEQEHGDDLMLNGNGETLVQTPFLFMEQLKRYCSPKRKEVIWALWSYRINVLNLSQRQAAWKAGIGVSTYKRVEGKKVIRQNHSYTVARICYGFGASPEILGLTEAYSYTPKQRAEIEQHMRDLAILDRQRRLEARQHTTTHDDAESA